MEDDDDLLIIARLNLACLLVERSSTHIHDGDSSRSKSTSPFPCAADDLVHEPLPIVHLK